MADVALVPTLHFSPPSAISIGDNPGDTRPSYRDRFGSSPLQAGPSNTSVSTQLPPSDYVQKVLEHSQTSIQDSLYSGNAFSNLARFLHAPFVRAERERSRSRSPSTNGQRWWFYELRPEASPTPVHISASSADRTPSHDASPFNSLVFLQGYPSAECLVEIGSRYKIDPEFFYRHLNFMANNHRRCNAVPFTLPSHQSTIFQMPLTSVGCHDVGQCDTRKKRSDAISMMDTYLHRLRVGQSQLWRHGHSIVRSYAVHDEEDFSIQQTATVYVSKIDKAKSKWIIVIWLDAGADLSLSPPGPWLDSHRANFHTYFHPVTLYKPNVAFKDHQIQTSEATPNDSEGAHTLAQSIALLPISYGKTLRPGIMCEDPFYALSELFDFVSCSEVQFLNSIASKLDLGSPHSSYMDLTGLISAQDDLVYYQRLIEEHIHRISETATLIKNRDLLNWPKSQNVKAATTAARIQQDFEYLQERFQLLQKRCEREMTTLMNVANVAEARRGVEQAKRGLKFTVLAAIYIPLSFSCSVFSMTFVQFADTQHGYWVWAIVTIPIFAVSLLIMTWDREALQRNGKRIRERFRI